jgi:predicted nucleic acid-binding protein
LLGDRACWTEAVREEVIQRGNDSRTECVKQVLRAGWLGDPEVIDDPVEVTEVFRLRDALARDGEHASAHLGECESIVLARRTGALLITNDCDARALAKSYGVPSVAMWKLLQALVEQGQLDAEILRLVSKRFR